MNVFSMARRSLRVRYVRSFLMISFIAAAAAALFLSGFIVDSVGERIEGAAQKMGADMIAVPRSAQEKVVKSIFAGEPAAFSFPLKDAEALSGRKEIAAMSPQLFLATLDASCCSAAVQIVAFDPATDFIVKPWLSGMHISKLKPGEIVVGSGVVAERGDTLEFFKMPFKVAGVLEKSGTGYDNCVFMDFAGARRLTASKGFLEKETPPAPDSASVVMLKLAPGTDPLMTAFNLNYGIPGLKLRLFTKDALFRSLSSSLRSMSSYFSLLTGLLCAVTFISMACIFTITVNERRREFGTLASAGASPRKLAALACAEGLLIGAAGAVLGIGTALLLLMIFSDPIAVAAGVPALDLSFTGIAGLALRSLALSLAAGLGGSLFAASMLLRRTPDSLIREEV